MAPTRHLLAVQIARQTTALFLREKGGYELRRIFRCSTSKYGVGEKSGSNMTPRGLHRIARKIGGGWPVGTAFEGRQVVGYTWQGQPLARIAHRILWLEGMEPGLNRGGNVDSFERYIYIHGTGHEMTLGQPDSHGCVHLSANDLLPLYDQVPEGTLVWLSA
jgi:L,D-transpeptidase YbiS